MLFYSFCISHKCFQIGGGGGGGSTLTVGANSKRCSTQFDTLTMGANSKHCSTQFYCFILKHVHATEESVALNKHIPVHTQFKGNNPFYILL